MGNFLNRKKRKQGFVAPPESEMKKDDMVKIINKMENRKRGQTEKDNYVEFISPRSEFSGKHCAKKIKKSRKHFVPGEEKEKCESYPGNGLAGSSKKEQHLKCFLDLFGEPNRKEIGLNLDFFCISLFAAAKWLKDFSKSDYDLPSIYQMMK